MAICYRIPYTNKCWDVRILGNFLIRILTVIRWVPEFIFASCRTYIILDMWHFRVDSHLVNQMVTSSLVKPVRIGTWWNWFCLINSSGWAGRNFPPYFPSITAAYAKLNPSSKFASYGERRSQSNIKHQPQAWTIWSMDGGMKDSAFSFLSSQRRTRLKAIYICTLHSSNRTSYLSPSSPESSNHIPSQSHPRKSDRKEHIHT
jgi:hypothetical protein